MFYELTNALRYNPKFSTKDVNEAFNSALNMGFKIRPVDSKVMEDAIGLAFKYNLPIYDAYFLALSRIEGKPFITADYKFTDRMRRFEGIIKLLDI